MGSKTFDGVSFRAYPDDRLPPHVHGRYVGIEVIVELVIGAARLARRDDAIRPPNAKRSDVAHILNTATRFADALEELWRHAHG